MLVNFAKFSEAAVHTGTARAARKSEVFAWGLEEQTVAWCVRVAKRPKVVSSLEKILHMHYERVKLLCLVPLHHGSRLPMSLTCYVEIGSIV